MAANNGLDKHFSAVAMEVTFDKLLKIVDALSPEQKRVLRQHLDENWGTRFGAALTAVHAVMPTGLSDEEVQHDVDTTIGDVRRLSKKLQ